MTLNSVNVQSYSFDLNISSSIFIEEWKQMIIGDYCLIAAFDRFTLQLTKHAMGQASALHVLIKWPLQILTAYLNQYLLNLVLSNQLHVQYIP